MSLFLNDARRLSARMRGDYLRAAFLPVEKNQRMANFLQRFSRSLKP
jgi:hypothetical protein